jgi:hypothetical protein
MGSHCAADVNKIQLARLLTQVLSDFASNPIASVNGCFGQMVAKVLIQKLLTLMGALLHFRQLFARFISFALAVPHLGVEALLAQQGRMRTAFENQALVQNDDFVGVDDR